MTEVKTPRNGCLRTPEAYILARGVTTYHTRMGYRIPCTIYPPPTARRREASRPPRVSSAQAPIVSTAAETRARVALGATAVVAPTHAVGRFAGPTS
eukprot:4311921-Pleurochrysis_carterae.AAC.3